MKVSYQLSRVDSASAVEFMNKVVLGVNQGYSELSDNLRSLVEWCGLEFVHNNTITVEVKICKEITIHYTQAIMKPSIKFFVRDPRQNNLTELVAETFKKTVVRLATELARGLRDNAKFLEDSVKPV